MNPEKRKYNRVMCQCGHQRGVHLRKYNMGMLPEDTWTCRYKICQCKGFAPKEHADDKSAD